MFRPIEKLLRSMVGLVAVVMLFSSCSSLETVEPNKRLDRVTTNAQYLETYKIGASAGGGAPHYKREYFLYGDLKIACHIYLPKNPIGTVFILHGYFDHAGSLRYAINSALQKGYAVFSYDLPGHGISSGEMGDIYGIENNASMLGELLTHYSQSLPMPRHLIGFSTGGAIAIEYSRVADVSEFQSIVLVSPLIRHEKWKWGRFAYRLFSPFKKHLKRVDKNNSSNIKYLEFAKNDPLRNSHLSLSFLADLYQWNDDLAGSSPLSQSFLVIQGDSDNVVDWKFNVNYLEANTTGSVLVMVKNAKHQLFNENENLRETVFTHIFDYFEKDMTDGID
ncbi:MAG: alpha/beta hydrolase [Cellvibrionaceae bacterium]